MEAIGSPTPAFKVPALSEEHQLLHLVESFNRAKISGYLSLFQGLRTPYHEMHNLLDEIFTLQFQSQIQGKSVVLGGTEETKEATLSQEYSLFQSQTSQMHERLVQLTQEKKKSKKKFKAAALDYEAKLNEWNQGFNSIQKNASALILSLQSELKQIKRID